MRRAHGAVTASVLLFLPKIAAAHGSIEGIGSFYGGLLHPLLVPTHVLVLLALGLCLGQQSLERVDRVLLLFGIVLAAGLISSLLLPSGLPQETLLLGLAVCAGGLAASALSLPSLVLGLVTIPSAFFIGIDSAPDAGGARATVLALAGTWICATYLLYLVVALASLTTRVWMKIGVRVLGSWTAASAVLVLALQFRR